MIISAKLCRRQQELFHQMERKDREIQDYKDQGTVVSRSKYMNVFCLVIDGNTLTLYCPCR